MKIKKETAVAMLVALGFPKAGEWPNDKLANRMGQLPSKFGADEIPDEFDTLFDELQASDPDQPIELTSDTGKALSNAKAKKTTKPVVESSGELFKPEVVEKPKAKAKKKAAAKKPAAKKAAKKKAAKPDLKIVPKPKAEPKAEPKATKPKKGAGAEPQTVPRIDSIKGQVYAQIGTDWTDEAAVIGGADIPFDQARRPLYHLRRAGKIERRSTGYQYRITPAK